MKSHVIRLLIGLAVIVPSVEAAGRGPKIQPDSALQLLMVGNTYFASGKPLRPDQSVARRTELASGQKPFAVVLTCADSRVAPEIYFDQGLGDIFVLRNAGNVLDDHVIGSIEYAVEHLGAGLIVVVGHSKCGAVAATVAGGHAPGHIGSIVESIRPAFELVADQPGDKVDNTVRAHARRVAALLERSGPILSEAVEKKVLKVVAARYDLASGKIELLEPLEWEATDKAAKESKGHEPAPTHADAHGAGEGHTPAKPATHGH